MDRISLSPWTNFLDKNYKDSNHMYKEELAVRLEEVIAKITSELMLNEKNDLNDENQLNDVKVLAVSLLMEQLLAIQYEHTPKAQAAMTVALFADLPELNAFKSELFKTIKNTSTLEDLKNNVTKTVEE